MVERRNGSPTRGRSTLTTSAPRSPSTSPNCAPETRRVRSRIRTPSRGPRAAGAYCWRGRPLTASAATDSIEVIRRDSPSRGGSSPRVRRPARTAPDRCGRRDGAAVAAPRPPVSRARLEQQRETVGRNGYDSVGVADDEVPGSDDKTGATDGDVDLTGAFLARQDCACRVARPVVSTGKRGRHVGNRVIEEHARCGCGLPSCGAAHAVDIRITRDGKHATGHVVHLVIGQRRHHLGPAVGRG